MSSEIRELREQLEVMRRRTTPMCSEMVGAFRAAQVRADSAYLATGNAAGAPPWVDGERLLDYRKRLVRQLQPLSNRWRNANLSRADEGSLRVAEDQIFSDAVIAHRAGADVHPGELRMDERKDETGRVIRKFHGDPMACWGPFMQPFRYVTRLGR